MQRISLCLRLVIMQNAEKLVSIYEPTTLVVYSLQSAGNPSIITFTDGLIWDGLPSYRNQLFTLVTK